MMRHIRKGSIGLIAAALFGCGPAEVPDSYDVLIINGTVYDGSLDAARSTNIGIVGEHIVSMDADAAAEAKMIVDATGLSSGDRKSNVDPTITAEWDLPVIVDPTITSE